jgi:hypothetical protein
MEKLKIQFFKWITSYLIYFIVALIEIDWCGCWIVERVRWGRLVLESLIF